MSAARPCRAAARTLAGLVALGLLLLAPGTAGADAAGPQAGYGAHLASYFNRADAERGWTILRRTLAEALSGRDPIYLEAEVGGRRYVRLMTGPFPTVAAAQSYCVTVKRNWSYCDVLSLADGRPVSEAAAAPSPQPAPPQPAPPQPAPTPPAPPPAPAEERVSPPPPLPVARPPGILETEPEPQPEPVNEAAPADDAPSGNRLTFASAILPAPPVAATRLTPQQRAIYAGLEGNWIQFDGDCRSDLTQIGEGAIRTIAGAVPQQAVECEARREGATVALFCPQGREYWFEAINEDELIFRRSRSSAGAEYVAVDQLLTRCRAG